ncbi:MAG: hypothetical protein R3A44_44445 [Caldilineaceae bacterium]
MAYLLSSFGTLTLPDQYRAQQMRPAPSIERFIQTVAGVYDEYGSGESRPKFPVDVTFRAVVSEETYTANVGVIDDWLGQMRLRNRLYRVPDDGGNIQWAYAVLKDVAEDRDQAHGKVVHMLDLTFAVISLWHGEIHGAAFYLNNGQYINDGEALNAIYATTIEASGDTYIFANDGTVRDRSPIFTITASDMASLSNVVITKAGQSHLVFAGEVEPTKTLTIDCGSMSVTNDGVDAYDDLSLGGTHKVDDWLILEKQNNSFVVSFDESLNATDNLIADGDFVSLVLPVPWTNNQSGSPTGTRTVVDTESRFGPYSYEIVKTGGATSDRFGTHTFFNTTIGQSYEFVAWVKVTAISGGSQTVQILPGSHSIVGVTSGWYRYTYLFTATGTTELVRIAITSGDTGTFYIDGVFAKQADELNVDHMLNMQFHDLYN